MSPRAGPLGEALRPSGPARDAAPGPAAPLVQIVVPVYDEGENVRRLYDALGAAGVAFDRARFVYDKEDDTSLPFIRALAAADPRVVADRNARGPGVLQALRHAFAGAAPGPVIVVMGDRSDDLARIPEMVRLWREGAVLVCASRYVPGGRQDGGGWLKRRLSRLAGRTLHFLGLPVSDPTNNFKLYDGTWLAAQEIESRGGFEVALELSYKAWRSGRPLAEVPAVWRDRDAGKSRFRLAAWLPHYLRWYLRAAGALLRERRRRRR